MVGLVVVAVVPSPKSQRKRVRVAGLPPSSAPGADLLASSVVSSGALPELGDAEMTAVGPVRTLIGAAAAPVRPLASVAVTVAVYAPEFRYRCVTWGDAVVTAGLPSPKS